MQQTFDHSEDNVPELEYRIVDGNDRQSVEEAINSSLRDGWALSGSLAVAVTRQVSGGPGLPIGIFYYAQAMTREREEKSVYENRGLTTL